MAGLWKAYLWLIGWNTSVTFPYHHLPKFIAIVGPHTSNWDFVIGVAYRSMLGLGYVKFLGKKELFRPPFGWIFRMLGGIPVDRQQHTNLVDEAAAIFNSRESFALALSPEGTRKKVDRLRTGFYYIARKAGVPIIAVGLDYANKTLIFGDAFMPEDPVKDFERIIDFYDPIKGRHPERGITGQQKSEPVQGSLSEL